MAPITLQNREVPALFTEWLTSSVTVTSLYQWSGETMLAARRTKVTVSPAGSTPDAMVRSLVRQVPAQSEVIRAV